MKVQICRNYNDYCFTSTIISNGPKNITTRKNLESSYIVTWKPDLNEKKDFQRLILFKNRVT